MAIGTCRCPTPTLVARRLGPCDAQGRPSTPLADTALARCTTCDGRAVLRLSHPAYLSEDGSEMPVDLITEMVPSYMLVPQRPEGGE
jgi:hypothetical protein